MTADQDLEAALDTVPPPSERRGDHGHDQALDRANGAKLLRLRAARMTYEQMATELGYADGSGARQALMRALDRHEAENARQLRDLENMALDSDERVLRTIIGDTTAGHAARIRAIDARTRLSARRARLNGIDAPVQVQLSAGVAADLADALRELDETYGYVPGEVLASTDEAPDGDVPTDPPPGP